MTRPRDIVDIDGLRDPTPTGSDADASRTPRKFLSVWYRCCHTYGRMVRNASGTAYEGRCPSCGARVCARIGPGGTSRRTFEAS